MCKIKSISDIKIYGVVHWKGHWLNGNVVLASLNEAFRDENDILDQYKNKGSLYRVRGIFITNFQNNKTGTYNQARVMKISGHVNLGLKNTLQKQICLMPNGFLLVGPYFFFSKLVKKNGGGGGNFFLSSGLRKVFKKFARN